MNEDAIESELADAGRKTNRGNGARTRPLGESVLRLIWSEREISRAEIARRMDLARSTVSEVVSRLLPTTLISEIGPGPSRGGRRPIVLRFEDDAFTILGIELGATHVAVALTDLRGRVLAWRERDHPVREDPEGTRALAIRLGDECLSTRGRNSKPPLGIGVAAPSPIDPSHPERLSELVLPAWGGLNRLEELRDHFKVAVLVDNDANLGALAEHWWGAGSCVEDFAYVKVATGVGSGHVIGGEIYRGATGVAGEIGHMAIDPKGGACICGLRGCLATLVGSPALVARATELQAEYPDSLLSGSDITIVSIEDAALAGDPLALQVLREAAKHLGIALAGMLNLMNPSRVIIGGSLARLGEVLLEPVRETIRRRTLVSSVAASEIGTSELGPRAIAIGAATMILKAALADLRLFPASVKHTETP